MGWRSPISSGPTASRLHNDDDDSSELSVFEGTKLFTKRRICWLIGMLGQVGVTVYFVWFLEPGKSINRTPGIPWTPEHEAAWVNATTSSNNSSSTNTTNTTTNLTSLQPSQQPSLMPTISSETNVAEAFMVLEPLGLELPSDASFSWTVATSATIQQSILEHERISVFFVQTRIIQQMVVVGGVIHEEEEEDGNSNSTNNPEGRRRKLQMKRLRRNLNSEDAVLIHFETTFFSGTYEKSALEQELVDAFADPERVQQYLLDLQQSNSFFLFQALQDATVYIEFEQATFPPSASPSTIPTTSSEPTMIPSTSAPMLVMPPTTTPTMATDVSTSPPTSTAPVVVPTQPPTPLPTTPPPVPSPTPPPTFPPTPTPPTPQPTPIPTTAAPVMVNPPPTPPPTNPPPFLPTPPPTTAELPLTVLGDFELLEEVPHDVTSFTQGLELVPNSNPTQYYESIGLYGEGAIRIVDLNSGVTLQEHVIDPELFAFGITKYNTQLLQLTWRAGYGFIYDANTLAELGTFPINTTNGEGWGICHDTTVNTQRLYVSDGTIHLHTWDATTKELLSKVQVTKRTDPTAMSASTVRRVNELEWDRFSNTILANVWQKNFIIRIDPQTGFVTHQYDLASLERPGDANVLNGIALTDIPNEIWVTGKLWPSMYRIRLL